MTTLLLLLAIPSVFAVLCVAFVLGVRTGVQFLLPPMVDIAREAGADPEKYLAAFRARFPSLRNWKL